MANSDVTNVLVFGEAVSGSSAPLVVVDVDAASHKDSEGNVPSDFLPETLVKFSFHAEPGVQLKALRDTAGGSVNIGAEVSRSHEQEIYFETVDSEVELAHYPDGSANVVWHGLGALLVQDEENPRKLKCSAAPRKCVVSYGYSATLCTHAFPSTISVGIEESFGVNVRAEYEYEEKG